MNIDADGIENAGMLNIRGELMSGDRVIAVIQEAFCRIATMHACRITSSGRRMCRAGSRCAPSIGTGRIRACFGDCTG